MFAVLYTTFVANAQPKVRAFLLVITDTLKILNSDGVEPPCIGCNGLCVHESVYSNGKGDTVFLLPVFKCYIPMKKSKPSADPAQMPQNLIDAIQLLSQAKQIVANYYKDRKDTLDGLFPFVFEIEDHIDVAAMHIGDVVSFEFQDKFYFNQERSVA